MALPRPMQTTQPSPAADHSLCQAAESPATDTAQTSFADALLVPQLAQACSEVVKLGKHHWSTGLKVLREVSRQCSFSMLAGVHSYTLSLSQPNLHQPLHQGTVKLLRHLRLSRLCIVVATQSEEPIRDRLRVHAYIKHYIESVGACLGSVSHITLEVVLQPNGTRLVVKAPSPSASLLPPMAAACPQMRSLCIGGSVGQPELLAFAACTQLTTLKLMSPQSHTSQGRVLPSTLHKLHSLLPYLSTFVMQGYVYHSPKHTEECFLAACTIPSLTSLDIPSLRMTETTWNALPSGLKALRVDHLNKQDLDKLDTSLPGFKQLNSLQHVTLNLNHGYCRVHDVHANTLAALVSLAPKLKEVTLGSAHTAATSQDPYRDSGVWCECEHSCINALVALDLALHAGLVVSNHVMEGPRPHKQLSLHLHVHELDELRYRHGYATTRQDERSICSFLDALPVCTSIKGLGITDIPLHQQDSRDCDNNQMSEAEPDHMPDPDYLADDAFWHAHGQHQCKMSTFKEESSTEAGELLPGFEWKKGYSPLQRERQHEVGWHGRTPKLDVTATAAALKPHRSDVHMHSSSSSASIPRSIARAFPCLQGLQLSVAADPSCTLHDLCHLTAVESLTLVHLALRRKAVASLPGLVPSLRHVQLFRCRLTN